ncbi:MAG: hypothetical protein ABIJ12_01490 [bacterium]
MRILFIITILFILSFGSYVYAEGYTPPEPIEKEHFIFYLDNIKYLAMADSLLLSTRAHLEKMLRDTIDYKLNVYIIEDLNYFQRIIKGHFPDWGAAAAYPPQRLIAIKSPDKFNLNKPLSELLAHEYTHLALSHRTGLHDAPRWFEEGMAMLTSTEWSWSDNLVMSKTAVFGDFYNLNDIRNVNRFNESQAHIAYSQSFLSVKYFFDNYSINGINIFLDSIASGATIDNALFASTGANYKEFNEEIKIDLRKRYNLITLFADTMYLWLGLAIVVIIGFFLRYKKRREYYKKWEEEEKLHSTDFDYGDPDEPEKLDDDEPWRS